jgi:hypothetical protein
VPAHGGHTLDGGIIGPEVATGVRGGTHG